MGKLLFANNASTTLLGNIGPTDNAISVPGGKGALFPNPADGNTFMATIESTSGAIEIVQCTGRAGDVLTVVRGREGTLAAAFSAGDAIEMRVTSGLLSEINWNDADGLPGGLAQLDADGFVPIAQFSGPLAIYGNAAWNPKLGYTPVQQGTGIGQLGNAVKLGWTAVSKLGATVDTTDLGNVAFEAWVTAQINAIPPPTTVAWSTLSGKPSTFPPSAHTHSTGDISGLDGALASKLNSAGGTISGNLSVSGALTGGTVTEVSDRRIKDNIRSMVFNDALKVVTGLRAVRYFNTLTGRNDFGFVAQDVEQVAPELILDGERMSLAYARLTAPIIAVLQDVMDRLAALEKK